MEWIEAIDDALTRGVVPDELPAEAAPATDVDEVNRLLRRLRKIDREQAKLDRVREREKAAIDEWHVEETGKLEAARNFIERALDGWARAEYEASGKQTHKLPHGELWLRKGRTSYVTTVQDAGDRIHAKDRLAHLVRTKFEVDKTALGEHTYPGVIVAKDETAGTVDREVWAMVRDPETKKKVRVRVPGVVCREPVEGVRGMTFNVKPRKQGAQDDG